VRGVRVARSGVMAALDEGVSACETDIVATTDDDAIPRPGWVAALLDAYSANTVGCVGGPDLVHINGAPSTEQRTSSAA
jgi:GT2 family glycosyltransferase